MGFTRLFPPKPGGIPPASRGVFARVLRRDVPSAGHICSPPTTTEGNRKDGSSALSRDPSRQRRQTWAERPRSGGAFPPNRPSSEPGSDRKYRKDRLAEPWRAFCDNGRSTDRMNESKGSMSANVTRTGEAPAAARSPGRRGRGSLRRGAVGALDHGCLGCRTGAPPVGSERSARPCGRRTRRPGS
jgi:hypothetical protein